MHLAITKDHFPIVKMLLESDFPLDEETDNGMTAFQLAAYHGRLDIIKYMIQYLKDKQNEEYKNYILKKKKFISTSLMQKKGLRCRNGILGIIFF